MPDDLNLNQPKPNDPGNLPVDNRVPPPLPPSEPPPVEPNLNPKPTEPPLIITTPPSNKFPLKKILAPLAVFLLLVSIPAAVFLIQQRQEVREKAAGECTNPNGNNGDWRYECTGNQESCPTDAGVGIPWRCEDGSWVNKNPAGECTPECRVGGGEGCQNPTGNEGDWRYECTGNVCNTDPSAGVGIPWRCEGSNWVNKNPSGECTRECQVGGGGDWHQCLYTDRDEPPENLPCGSCSVPNVGSGTMNFGCELDCGGSPSKCPGGQAGSYSIAHRWERCSTQGTQACTPSSSDYIGSGDLGGPGPWTIAGQSTVNGSGTFPNPGCGRVQVDVQMPQTGTAPGTDVFNTGRDCAGAPQPTPTPTPGEPPPAPQCRQIKAYDTNWNPLSASQLSQLRPGDRVRWASLGDPGEEFTRARFRVNQGTWQETTTKKPQTNEFYVEYVIPAGVTSFKVEAEVYHRDQGWK